MLVKTVKVQLQDLARLFASNRDWVTFGPFIIKWEFWDAHNMEGLVWSLIMESG